MLLPSATPGGHPGGFLQIVNDDWRITDTNFWDTSIAQDGKFLVTANAGHLRLLVPEAREGEMTGLTPGVTGITVLALPQAQWQHGEPCVQWVFENGSATPFALELKPGAFPRPPGITENAVALAASLWIRRQGKPHCLIQLPLVWRTVPTLDPNPRVKTPRADAGLPVAVRFDFTRREVETMDLSRFLYAFDVGRLHGGSPLAQFMGTVTLGIDGYHSDPRDLWEIPEVRRFYQALWQAWPYGLFFGDLSNGCLHAVILCCLQSVQTMRRTGNPVAELSCRPADLHEFLLEAFGPLNELSDRAGLSDQANQERTRALVEYFMRPFVLPVLPDKPGSHARGLAPLP